MLFNIIGSFLIIVLLIYLLVLAGLYFFQEKLIFPGAPLPADHQFEFDLPFEEVTIPVKGAAINALHFKQDNPRGLIFFLHGNGGNLQSWTTGADYYQKVNYDMFMIDYRGYGKSSGHIDSQQQLYQDVLTAWKSVAPHYQEQNKPIVIYGRSLGSSLAVKLATQVKADALILVSAFTNLNAMAQRGFPWAPSWLLRYSLPTDELIADIQIPTTFFHGTEDTFIPPSDSQELQSHMRNDSLLILIDGAGHGDIHQFQSYTIQLTKALP